MEVVLNKNIENSQTKKADMKRIKDPVCLTSDKPESNAIACHIELY